MIASLDLSQLFLFPVKDNEARRSFLLVALVYFAGFIIPILPLIVSAGYSARVMRQIVGGGEARMPAWDNWDSMLKDGLYLFGVRLVCTLPLIVLVFPFFFGVTFMPLWLQISTNAGEQIFILMPIIFGIAMLILVPLSLALGIIIPAAEVHVIIADDFSAAFRIREWWAIFRTNWTGFLLAYLIAIITSLALSTIVSIAMMTIILFCVVPFIMPVISAYTSLVMYAAFAHAYRYGTDRIKQTAPVVNSGN